MSVIGNHVIGDKVNTAYTIFEVSVMYEGCPINKLQNGIHKFCNLILFMFC